MFQSPKGTTEPGRAGSQAGNPASAHSTPPPGQQQHSQQQQQAANQQTQPQPPQATISYPYPAGAHPAAYPIHFPFNLVPHGPPPPHHSHQLQPSQHGTGGNPQHGGAASTLIDPRLSTLSDGDGGGMSEDEGAGGATGGGAAGVKGGPNATSQHEDEEYTLDEAQQLQTVSGLEGHPQPPGPDGGPAKKKRRRQALSCTECKRRKIKCDRANPCGPCTRRAEGDKCQWATQEPLSAPDPNLSSLSSEKFVTRAEHDLLQQKVMQLETIVATLAPRAFLGTLEHLNIPIAPPPFGFGPPPGAPGHPGAPNQPHPPPHHAYAGPPPGQEAHFQGAANPTGAPTAHDLQQAYQHHFQSYHPHAPPQPQPQASESSAAPAASTQGSHMEVDQENVQPQSSADGPTNTIVQAEPVPHPQQQQPQLLGVMQTPPQPVTASRPKPRKRKQMEGEGPVPAEDGPQAAASQASTVAPGTPSRGGPNIRGKAKVRTAKAVPNHEVEAANAAQQAVPDASVLHPGHGAPQPPQQASGAST